MQMSHLATVPLSIEMSYLAITPLGIEVSYLAVTFIVGTDATLYCMIVQLL